MKILMHAINGVGLGHVTRTRRMADALREKCRDIEIAFVTNSKFSEVLQKKYKTYALKQDTRDVLEKKYSYETYLKYNAETIAKIILKESPDAVLFDSELNKKLLSFCQEKGIKTVYVLRRVSPKLFSMLKDSLAQCDKIIVPHDEEEFLGEQVQFLKEQGALFVGPIVEDMHGDEVYERKNVLVTFGAGANIPCNQPLFAAVDSFLSQTRSNAEARQFNVKIVTGPFYEKGCDFEGFDVIRTIPHLTREMLQAKVVICAAGYNTINEIVYTKTPAVVFPVLTQGEDQLVRAERLEKMGCVKCVREDIFSAVRDVLENWEQYHKRFPDIEPGNGKAADVLINLLKG